MKALSSTVISISGVIAFALIVTYLHLAQEGYDPVHQLMSELALGRHGSLMLVAFSSLALSLLALAFGAGKRQSWTLLSGLLAFAALCFLGAGIFPLGATSEIHILLVAAAFVAVGVAMYLTPSHAQARHLLMCRRYSWGILAAFVLSACAGGLVMPMGVSQRCAAAAMLLWIVISAWRLERQEIARVAPESQVVILPEGIKLLNDIDQPMIPWAAIMEVALEWDENPWGDPVFGNYNDISWVLKLADSRQFRIDDCETHRLVLQAAFSMYLPGYASVPDNFDMTYAKQSGRLSCWVKAI